MIATSADGQWAVVRRGRVIELLERGAGPALGRLELASDDVELALVGPPTVLAVVARDPAPGITLYQPPLLDAPARVELDAPMRLAAVTGPRMVLLPPDGKQVTIVRAAGLALATQPLELGSPVEFAVGLDRNQVLFGLLRKLEVWDAVSARPLLRLQLQLPPPPRRVGAAQGHLWVTRPGTDELFVFRLSDGRPFRHYVGAPVDDVICHPASPLIVLVTRRGLVRVHCFAHSLTVLDAPWAPGTALAQLAAGEDIRLLGLGANDPEPWQVPLAGPGVRVAATEPVAWSEPQPEPSPWKQAAPWTSSAPAAEPAPLPAAASAHAAASAPAAGSPPPPAPLAAAASAHAAASAPAPAPLSAVESGPAAASLPAAASAPAPAPLAAAASAPAPAPLAAPAMARAVPRAHTWRDPVAAYGLELARDAAAEPPVLGDDNELGELSTRLALSPSARRALLALYGLYLVGEPALAIARLSHALGDWTEPLGQGDLAALAMLDRRSGRVALRAAATDLLDGLAPRSIRPVGGGPPVLRPDVACLPRGASSDAAIEAALATQLGQIAVLDGSPRRGVLEARLHGITAVALVAPAAPPTPWPRGAGLIVVAEAAAPAWVSALPTYGEPDR